MAAGKRKVDGFRTPRLLLRGIRNEQATNNYTKGTIDGKIDELDSNGQKKYTEGQPINRKGFEK